MTEYGRPTERVTKVVAKPFWARIVRDDPARPVRQVTQSPAFETQAELQAWVKAHRRDGDQLEMWRREKTGGGFRDISLLAFEDDVRPDPARLAEILGPLAEQFAARSEGTRKKSRTSRASIKAIGEAARARLADAGARMRGDPDE